jgi:hypothetical protein
MAQPEARLSKKTVVAMKAEGAFATKIHGGIYQASLPDIIGCYKKRFFGVEMKLPGKEHTLTERQAHKLEVIQAAGGRVGVATTVDQALAIMKGEAKKWKNPYGK